MSAASPTTEPIRVPKVWNLPNLLTTARLGLAVVLFLVISDEDWLIVLSHEPSQPIGRLTRDRDRYRYEPA